MINPLHELVEEFKCDKCTQIKSIDGALIHRDPRIDYCICRECRDVLVDLLGKVEFETVLSFLGVKKS